MAANKAAERFATFTLKMPAVTIASGAPLVFGHGTHAVPCVAVEAQISTNPPYDSGDGYLTVDMEGAYFLSVVAEVLGCPSAGAAIKVGDPVYYAGGTFDAATGITYGGTICVDTTGDFFGLALQAVAAGTTATIPVLLRNAC